MPRIPNSPPIALQIADFGPIAQANIELRPLTAFVGPNNTGKSFLAMLVYVLHKCMGRAPAFSSSGPYRYGRKRDMGRNAQNAEASTALLQPGDITQATVEELMAWIKAMRAKQETGEPNDRAATVLPEALARIVRPLLSRAGELAPAIAEEMTRCFGVDDVKALIRHESETGLRVWVRSPRLELNASPAEAFAYEIERGQRRRDFAAIFPDHASLSVSIRDVLEAWSALGVEAAYAHAAQNDDLDPRNASLPDFMDRLCALIVSHTFGPLRREAYYVPAARAGIMHAHRVVAGSLMAHASRAGLERTSAPWPFLSGILADFLEQLAHLDSPPNKMRPCRNGRSAPARRVARQLETNILKGAIRQRHTPKGYPVFAYQPDGWPSEIPLQNASSTVSEIAPAVLYLRHIVTPGETLIIEEPEAHLHPAQQVEFTRQLAIAARSGIRILITTHSEWLLDALANLVRLSELAPHRQRDKEAEYALSPDQVGVWRFHAKQSPGGSEVEEIALNKEYGSFPAGYGDVADDAYNEYVDISNRMAYGALQ